MNSVEEFEGEIGLGIYGVSNEKMVVEDAVMAKKQGAGILVFNRSMKKENKGAGPVFCGPMLEKVEAQ